MPRTKSKPRGGDQCQFVRCGATGNTARMWFYRCVSVLPPRFTRGLWRTPLGDAALGSRGGAYTYERNEPAAKGLRAGHGGCDRAFDPTWIPTGPHGHPRIRATPASGSRQRAGVLGSCNNDGMPSSSFTVNKKMRALASDPRGRRNFATALRYDLHGPDAVGDGLGYDAALGFHFTRPCRSPTVPNLHGLKLLGRQVSGNRAALSLRHADLRLAAGRRIQTKANRPLNRSCRHGTPRPGLPRRALKESAIPD
jgi:hypothetical protein